MRSPDSARLTDLVSEQPVYTTAGLLGAASLCSTIASTVEVFLGNQGMADGTIKAAGILAVGAIYSAAIAYVDNHFNSGN
jgi:hypothetical protein